MYALRPEYSGPRLFHFRTALEVKHQRDTSGRGNVHACLPFSPCSMSLMIYELEGGTRIKIESGKHLLSIIDCLELSRICRGAPGPTSNRILVQPRNKAMASPQRDVPCSSAVRRHNGRTPAPFFVHFLSPFHADICLHPRPDILPTAQTAITPFTAHDRNDVVGGTSSLRFSWKPGRRVTRIRMIESEPCVVYVM